MVGCGSKENCCGSHVGEPIAGASVGGTLKKIHKCNIYKNVAANDNDSVVYINGGIDQFTIDLSNHRGNKLAIYGRSVSWGGTTYAYWTKD